MRIVKIDNVVPGEQERVNEIVGEKKFIELTCLY